MPEIVFTPTNKDASQRFLPPRPASEFLPQWYKDQSTLTSESMTVGDNGILNSTIKRCMPILDDMMAGYIICLSSDILVSLEEDGNPRVNWSVTNCPGFISSHSSQQVSCVPMPEEYSPFPLKFENFYRITTPPGYSCLFKHPTWINPAAPFMCFSGIVDTDAHPIPVFFPFLIKKGFTGVIEMGTPIMQVIPFKRENWDSRVEGEDNEAGALEFDKTTVKWSNRYKNNFRSLKSWK
ncbi:hypothetical protein UFOVP929_24 [uncultured Caudovirales phage]|uniref:Uncharacterized protein n=1 Tax=uncultured Caudovirales phage TaxID=2100421 RepID=A0A6J5PJZ3_9CAUD|nr:hypothetical protein UFOVP929_24 [uncultured Caudovirales phage]